jgi:hypothetical protein
MSVAIVFSFSKAWGENKPAKIATAANPNGLACRTDVDGEKSPARNTR